MAKQQMIRLSMDQQICDPTWLDRAMPEWFKSGGNIREQHSNIAAGVAKEYEAKNDGHYISALWSILCSVKKSKRESLSRFLHRHQITKSCTRHKSG
jgi:hypothetical protein